MYMDFSDVTQFDRSSLNKIAVCRKFENTENLAMTAMNLWCFFWHPIVWICIGWYQLFCWRDQTSMAIKLTRFFWVVARWCSTWQWQNDQMPKVMFWGNQCLGQPILWGNQAVKNWITLTALTTKYWVHSLLTIHKTEWKCFHLNNIGSFCCVF